MQAATLRPQETSVLKAMLAQPHFGVEVGNLTGNAYAASPSASPSL